MKVAIPINKNIRNKDNWKIAKYRDFEIQIKRQCEIVKIQKVSIIISPTGAIPKNIPADLKLMGLNEHLFRPKFLYYNIYKNINTMCVNEIAIWKG